MGSVQNLNILIYGLGAIGGTYAFFLSRSPRVALSVIARSNYDAVQKKGMTINSMNYGQHSFKAKHVFKSAAEAGQNAKYDYVICAHKATNQDAAAEDLRPVISSGTTIVITQNGVGNEDAFRSRYPNNSIISCAVWIGADQRAPGEFITRNREHTDLGLFPNPAVDAAVERQITETYAGLLKDAGHSVTLEENIQIKKWEKLVCNILWNPVSVITRKNMGLDFLTSSEEVEDFARALIHDIVAVGRRSGVPLDDSLADKYINFTKQLGSFEPSMLHDFNVGIPLEIDIIVGSPMRKARALGMEVPTLRAVYVLVCAISRDSDNS
ncbi:ketopantoate reductase PanE/ApbA-domain-containing protein [Xylariales sp. PMI_506]|nr:ketopantoate reductase PanE/ApbA-domain-containing protein [Xylariales sp. PMI_506]